VIKINDVPMVGPTGERDNIQRVAETLQALVPRGMVVIVTVEHDAGCPTKPCTCETVNLIVDRAKNIQA
jgi:hypothetical protein